MAKGPKARATLRGERVALCCYTKYVHQRRSSPCEGSGLDVVVVGDGVGPDGHFHWTRGLGEKTLGVGAVLLHLTAEQTDTATSARATNAHIGKGKRCFG